MRYSVSNTRMAVTRPHRVEPFLQNALSFSVFILGIGEGILGIAVVADMPVFPGYFDPEWPKVLGYALVGFIGLGGSILALQSRRQAGTLFLLTAPIAAWCFGWLWRNGISRPGDRLSLRFVVFGVALLPLAIPGAFWMLSSRLRWSALASPFVLSRRYRLSAGALLFIVCMLVAIFISFYIPKYGWADCHQEYPPLSVQQFSDQAVFVGNLVFVGNSRLDPNFSEWCLMQVRHRFWGLPWWAPGYMLVRGFFRVEPGEYLVDARRSQGLLTHFLPFVERYPCCHTEPVRRAVADLRALRDGPPKTGVRIMGTVYTDMFVTSEPARNAQIIVKGPTGTVFTRTDQEGIYDVSGLPPGHYSVEVGPDSPRSYLYEAQGNVNTGQVWGATLIAHGTSSSGR